MSLRWKIAQKAELSWWKNYLKGKSPEEYLVWKKEYWIDFLKKIPFEPIDKQKALDAGCGPAGIFTVLNKQKVVAIDPLLTAYKEKLPHFDFEDYPWVNFLESSIEDYQHSEKFDVIFCINAINHVDNLNQSFDRLVENLKKGGKVVLSIDAHNHPLLKSIFQLIPGDILHPHQYDKKEYAAFLEKRGIKIIKEKCISKAFIFNYWVLIGEKI